MRMTKIGMVILLNGVLPALCVGCKNDNSSSCAPGRQRSCSDCSVTGDVGVETCNEDGSSWGDCTCSGDGTCESDIVDFQSCLDCRCANELEICNSNIDCGDLLDCLVDCGQDTACQTECSNEYPSGVNDLVSVLDCRDYNCADYAGGDTDTDCTSSVTDFNTCLGCYCEGEVETCNASSNCIDLLTCLNDCGTDTTCQDGCVTDYPNGVNDLSAVFDCRDANCTDYMTDTSQCAADVTDFDTCLQCYCFTELGICDSNQVCVDLAYCLTDCGSDTVCQDGCFTDYADGSQDFLGVIYCRDDNCADYLTAAKRLDTSSQEKNRSPLLLRFSMPIKAAPVASALPKS